MNYEHDEADVSEPSDGAGLLEFFKEGMASLMDRDLDRAKRLLRQGALSGKPYDQEVTARCAPALARHDFELARDIVVYIQNSDGDLAFDAAIDASNDIRRTATPEQRADLDAAEEAALQAYERVVPSGLAT
jgi:hypothetical protein